MRQPSARSLVKAHDTRALWRAIETGIAIEGRDPRRNRGFYTSFPMSFTIPRKSKVRGRFDRGIDYMGELWRRREFAWYLALGNLKARNASTVLGLMWWLLNPLLLGGVYFLVFGLFFGSRGPNYISYLMSGMFVFHFTNMAMTGGANSILQNSRLLTNLKFPRLILPLANLIEASIGFVVSIGVALIVRLIEYRSMPGLEIAWLLLIFPLHLMFNLGLSAVTARLSVPFRDINNFVPYVNRLWLYLSPIIWPLSRLDGASAIQLQLIQSNPMYSIIAVYRMALLGSPMDSNAVISAVLWSVGTCVVGVLMFIKYEGHIVRHL